MKGKTKFVASENILMKCYTHAQILKFVLICVAFVNQKKVNIHLFMLFVSELDCRKIWTSFASG